jgi:signal peptidase II
VRQLETNHLRFSARLAVLLITMLSCVGCDQVTKSLVHSRLVIGQAVSLFGDVVRLQYQENAGAFLSAGNSLPSGARRALFTFGGTVLVAGAMGWALFSQRTRLSGTIGAALICSGGLGNLIDRFSQGGYVTDFLNVGIGAVRNPGIFNVADMALMLGILLVLLDEMAARHQ